MNKIYNRRLIAFQEAKAKAMRFPEYHNKQDATEIMKWSSEKAARIYQRIYTYIFEHSDNLAQVCCVICCFCLSQYPKNTTDNEMFPKTACNTCPYRKNHGGYSCFDSDSEFAKIVLEKNRGALGNQKFQNMIRRIEKMYPDPGVD